jgi:hypothetical protein
MMMAMPETENRVAFLTAAVVLLVMPFVFVVGLASMMLVMRAAGLYEMGQLMVAVSLMWGLVVMAVALVIARHLIRRSARRNG